MATEEISAQAITTNLTTSVEQQLAQVRARIAELREAESVLVNVLTTLHAGNAAVPESHGGEGTTHDAGKAPASAAGRQEKPARRGRRRGAAAEKSTGTATGRRTPRAGRTPAKPEPEPVRVLRFLLPLREPQTAAEIARGIYQDAAGQTETNRVRSAAESLTRRGALERTHQGRTVFYQVATDPSPAAEAVNAAESAPGDE
jgi:TolA-binding protein